MTNRNTSWNGNRPFLLHPACKDYLWGGRRLKDDFSKETGLTPLAETWECSTHPDGPSVIASGSEAGRTLLSVLKEHPDYIGTSPLRMPDGGLPVMVKLIDAAKDLSVQVHPDDDYAAEHENGSLGKTEMWYVVDAKPDAKLVYGFSRNMTERLVRQSLAKGNIERYLQKVPVHKDDVFVIRPGTMHGIGAGTLVAEIQESSNVTYRVYDYNRLDKDGKKRQLHIEKALEVADLGSAARPRQPIRTLRYRPGWASELLYRCRYFQVERILINTERVRCMADFRTDDKSFQIWLCVDGCGVVFEDGCAQEDGGASGLQQAEGQALRIFRGDCMFVPASSVQLKLHGKAQFLRVTC